jgi:glucose dehydrogenase
VGNPAPDFDVARRTGDNLYSNSVIALEAATGRMLAYNQIVTRDAHDWDVDSPPTLVITPSVASSPTSRAGTSCSPSRRG